MKDKVLEQEESAGVEVMFPLQRKGKDWWKFCEKMIYACNYFQSGIDIFSPFHSLQSIFYMYLFPTEG